MKRLSLLFVLLLCACPSYIDGAGRIEFSLEDSHLKITSFEGDIVHGAFGIYATDISSDYCVDSCRADANGIIYLLLPERSWPKTVDLGIAHSDVLGGKASVVIEGVPSALEDDLIFR